MTLKRFSARLSRQWGLPFHALVHDATKSGANPFSHISICLHSPVAIFFWTSHRALSINLRATVYHIICQILTHNDLHELLFPTSSWRINRLTTKSCILSHNLDLKKSSVDAKMDRGDVRSRSRRRRVAELAREKAEARTLELGMVPTSLEYTEHERLLT